jgi:hypothetical protein
VVEVHAGVDDRHGDAAAVDPGEGRVVAQSGEADEVERGQEAAGLEELNELSFRRLHDWHERKPPRHFI